MFRVEYFLSFVLRVCVCLFVWLHLLFSHCPCSYIFLTNFSFFLSFFQLTDSHSLIYSPFVYAFLFNFPPSPPSLILLYLMSLCVCVCVTLQISLFIHFLVYFSSLSLFISLLPLTDPLNDSSLPSISFLLPLLPLHPPLTSLLPSFPASLPFLSIFPWSCSAPHLTSITLGTSTPVVCNFDSVLLVARSMAARSLMRGKDEGQE